MVSLTITLRSKRDSRDRRISLGILASIGIPMPRRVFPHDAWKSVAPHPSVCCCVSAITEAAQQLRPHPLRAGRLIQRCERSAEECRRRLKHRLVLAAEGGHHLLPGALRCCGVSDKLGALQCSEVRLAIEVSWKQTNNGESTRHANSRWHCNRWGTARGRSRH